eukprot:TRINITY_DN12476_c0_g1_i1.p1 TRINITY_DN12476_c0_g1~~TRINITY_DN12476_c0_g1_i1.p1  ORF type:complete len:731 (+),score=140.52 TRINITY_DN12476_c0_g1_i1:3-2195(+)
MADAADDDDVLVKHLMYLDSLGDQPMSKCKKEILKIIVKAERAKERAERDKQQVEQRARNAERDKERAERDKEQVERDKEQVEQKLIKVESDKEHAVQKKDELFETLLQAKRHANAAHDEMRSTKQFQSLSRRAYAEMSVKKDCSWQAMLQEGVDAGEDDDEVDDDDSDGGVDDNKPSNKHDDEHDDEHDDNGVVPDYGVPALEDVEYTTHRSGKVVANLIGREKSTRKTCHRPRWTDEAHRQNGLKAMSVLLNKVQSNRLHWDLSISSTPTLRYLKPDGHGRIDKQQPARHAAGQAVLIEVKATDKMNASETRGQILEYCTTLLQMDPRRKHVLVFLTDLETWRLYKVTRLIFQPFVGVSRTQGILCSHDYPWKQEGKSGVLGFEMLAHLGSRSNNELGLSPQTKQLQHHLIDTFLGEGLTATVYKLDNGRVLKLARASSKAREDVKAEVDILVHLREHDIDMQYKTFFPHVRESKLTKNGEGCKFFTFKPSGQRLAAAVLIPAMIQEFLVFLRWLHEDAKIYHGDVSYRNMLQAPNDWTRTGVSRTPQIVLIDWGLSRSIPSSGVTRGAQGTPATLSQSMLKSIVAGRAGSFKYTVADELESTVKSFILILAPSVKRGIKLILGDKSAAAHAPSREAIIYKRLMLAWDSLLKPTGLLALCQASAYDKIAAWFCNPNNRYFVMHPSHISPSRQSAQQQDKNVRSSSKRKPQSRQGGLATKKAKAPRKGE